MCKFILRRLLYSFWIVLGVLLLTFALFNVAAGDPAAAVLGEHADAAEVESLRRTLGSDLPLFFGFQCRTEAFPAIDFLDGWAHPKLRLTNSELAGSGLTLGQGGRAEIPRNFATDGELVANITFSGELAGNGVVKKQKKMSRAVFPVRAGQTKMELESPTGAVVAQISFARLQPNPFHSQFVRAVGEIVSFSKEKPYVSFFNFGKSISTREPIGGILSRGILPSLFLMLPIFLGELVLGIVLALLATAFKDTAIDKGLMILSVAGISVSYLVVIIFAQWFLGYYYNFFPVWGYGECRFLLLPILIGIACGLGGGVRFYRSCFVNELQKEYLRTARAKGCSPAVVYGKHLLRNAAIPIITRASSVLPFLFTGSLLLETFFGIPGLGYASVDALKNSDLQLLKALVIISAFLFIALNLLADLACAMVDPRVKLGEE